MKVLIMNYTNNYVIRLLESKYTECFVALILCSSSLFTYGKELFDYTLGFHTGHGVFIFGLMSALKSLAMIVTSSRMLIQTKRKLS
jgi:hypothetical protein